MRRASRPGWWCARRPRRWRGRGAHDDLGLAVHEALAADGVERAVGEREVLHDRVTGEGGLLGEAPQLGAVGVEGANGRGALVERDLLVAAREIHDALLLQPDFYCYTPNKADACTDDPDICVQIGPP